MKTLFFLLLSLPCLSQDNTPFALGTPTHTDSLLRLNKASFAVLYSHALNEPRLTAWHLVASDIGTADRFSGFFAPELGLPRGWFVVHHQDYAGTGYDQGHLCPNADRNTTLASDKATFILSNALPQHPKLNRVVWLALEDWARKQVEKGKEAYIMAGGIDSLSVLPGMPVVVPGWCWKLIVLLPEGTGDAGRIGTARVLAVIMPNDATAPDHRWPEYTVSLARLEARTGLVFGWLH